jgi:transient receptor potential cation channel subfamily M protein 2
MIKYLYSDTGFNLPEPKMILSITGGAKKFSIDKDTKRAFKLGLMKAAKTTKAWIISGGTNAGVMRLVGDAVAQDLNAKDLTVLGIASWGCIDFNEELIV